MEELKKNEEKGRGRCMEEDVGYPYLLQSIPQSKHHEVAELGNSVTPIGKELGNSATPTNNRSTKQGESATTSVKRSTEELNFSRSILRRPRGQ